MKLHKRGDGDAMETAPLENSKPKSRKKSQQSVIVYVTILFTVAFLLVLLSYFMQQRKNEDAMTDLTEQHTQFTAQAQQNIESLQNKNIELQTQITEMQESLQALESQFEEVTKENENLKEELENETKLLDDCTNELIAHEALITLMEAVEKEDKEAIKVALNSIEDWSKYLSGTYLEKYETIKEIYAEEVNQND